MDVLTKCIICDERKKKKLAMTRICFKACVFVGARAHTNKRVCDSTTYELEIHEVNLLQWDALYLRATTS